MNKKIGIIKRIFALLLVFLLSINSFAAVVSDNDGSAFITKAEFDSLKNNFQSQIDQYNTSIDAKIDGAIAQYLVGIKLSSAKAQMIPWTSGEVTFGEIRNVDLGARDPIIYMPSWKNNYAAHLADFVQDHNSNVFSSDNVNLKNTYGKCWLGINGGSASAATALQDEDIAQFKAAIGCADTVELKTKTKAEIRAAMLKALGYNIMLTKDIDGFRVFDGMALMGTGSGQSQFTLVYPFKRYSTYSNFTFSKFYLDRGSNNMVEIGSFNPIAFTTKRDLGRCTSNSSFWYYALQDDSYLNLDMQVDGKTSTISWIGKISNLLFSETKTSGGKKQLDPWRIAANYSSGDSNLQSAGTMKYCDADHIQADPTDGNWSPASDPTSSTIPSWIYNWTITNSITTPLFNPTNSYCHPAPALFARNKNSHTWVDQSWPEWLWFNGPQFTDVTDNNTGGSWGGAVVYYDYLYSQNSSSGWTGDLYASRPELTTGYTQKAHQSTIGYLPFYIIKPASDDYIKLSNIYAPAYGSAVMSQYGKSVFDGACICKTDSKGDLTVILSSTAATKLYFNKEPFSTSTDTGNISYKVGSTTYAAGDGINVSANIPVTITISGVQIDDRFYVKPEDATTIKFLQAEIVSE